MACPVIELFPGAHEHAFAAMMVQLIQTNLLDHPEKLEDFNGMRGRIALVAEDASAAITLCFGDGKMRVHVGVHGIPDLVVRGPSESLIDLSRIPPHGRFSFLPDFGSDAARAIGKALRDKQLRLHGLFSHLPLGLRLSRILSIY